MIGIVSGLQVCLNCVSSLNGCIRAFALEHTALDTMGMFGWIVGHSIGTAVPDSRLHVVTYSQVACLCTL